jgi:hypothetical protein
MSASRVHGALPILFAVSLVLPFLLAGCGDDSRTTGTHVELSEQQKAEIKDMKNMYKDMKGMRKKGD